MGLYVVADHLCGRVRWLLLVVVLSVAGFVVERCWLT